MKQSKLISLMETILSTVIGFAVALATQVFVFPLFGFHPALHENLAITAIFTIVSLVRQFVMRRLFEALHIRRPLSAFTQAVVAERFRQIEQEGWSAEHDDDHHRGDLAIAGACYAIASSRHGDPVVGPLGHAVTKDAVPPSIWPWSMDWWKPTAFRRDLVKACALIIAEGEKFDRSRKSRPAA